MKYEAQDADQQQAANADAPATEAAKPGSAATAALAPAIFNVFVGTAGCPLHDMVCATQVPKCLLFQSRFHLRLCDALNFDNLHPASQA